VCLSIPTVFIARFIGFSKAPYLEFDVSGVQDPTALKAFKTDDGERLQQLLSSAGGSIMGATKTLASGAGQAGKLLATRIREQATTRYFYRSGDGVPKGPVPADDLRRFLTLGSITSDTLVAESGSAEWRPLSSVLREQERSSA
jgi:hypothetical protein